MLLLYPVAGCLYVGGPIVSCVRIRLPLSFVLLVKPALGALRSPQAFPRRCCCGYTAGPLCASPAAAHTPARQTCDLVWQAIRERKRCVTAHWLNMVLKKKKLVPPHRALHFPVAFPPGGKPCSQHVRDIPWRRDPAPPARLPRGPLSPCPGTH